MSRSSMRWHGIVVLRTDDRGAGRSSGHKEQSSVEDLAGDLVVGGLAIEAPLMFGTTGVARGVTFGIAPFDPIWLVALALLVAAIGLAAAYVPARRALAVAAVIALRQE
jgi:hypothetical protein